LALGQIGEKAAAAVPELRLALADEDSEVRHSAAVALGETGEKAAEDALISTADSEQVHESDREEILRILLERRERFPRNTA
jgi:HEAT repeat protein